MTVLVEREGMNKRRKQVKQTRKEKKGKVKKAKDEEVNGQGRKKAGKGVLCPNMG